MPEICLTCHIWSLLSSASASDTSLGLQHKQIPPFKYPGLESYDSALMREVLLKHTNRSEGKKQTDITSTQLWGYIVTQTLPNPTPPVPPRSLHARINDPTRPGLIYSEQTEEGLAQNAAICRNHCAGRTLAASGSLISHAQLFSFVMVDCGWAVCLGVGHWAEVGTRAEGVNRFCVCVCVCVLAICADTQPCSSVE